MFRGRIINVSARFVSRVTSGIILVIILCQGFAANAQEKTHDPGNDGNAKVEVKIPAGFDKFPNLHSFFVLKRPMSYATMALLFGGFAGGVLAAKIFHAHPDGLTGNADTLFENDAAQHDQHTHEH